MMEISFIFITNMPRPDNEDLARTFEVVMWVEWNSDGRPEARGITLYCTTTDCKFPIERLPQSEMRYLHFCIEVKLHGLERPDSGGEPEDIPGNDR